MEQCSINTRHTKATHSSNVQREPWSEQEVTTLLQYAHSGCKVVGRHLPHRSLQAIRHKAMRLGISFGDNATLDLCIRCHQHPVWKESSTARYWMLCQACETRRKVEAERETTHELERLEAEYQAAKQINYRLKHKHDKEVD